jgi:2-amino-4-hydroxy-6-hydroxymethyldihydropteridine diphosphokinase
MPSGATRVAIAMGSNLGDRRAHLEYAVEALRPDLSDLRVSTFLESEPANVGPEHGPYLNAAAVGYTTLSPRLLLDRLLEIESERGRFRPYAQAPRTLDLDLILYGSWRINEDGLVVPHPRFSDREFVLEPLDEIAGEMIDPVSGQTIAALLVAKRHDRV